METNAGQRLRRYISYLVMERMIETDSEFAERIGVQPSYLSEIIRGKRSLTDKFSSRIKSEFSSLNEEWLLGGKGEMLNFPHEDNTTLRVFEDDKTRLSAFSSDLIPEIEDPFRAGNDGNPILHDDGASSYWALPKIDADMVIPVEGDSMSPLYPAGSRLAVKRLQFDPTEPYSIPFGEVFAVTVKPLPDDDYIVGYIKRLKKHTDIERSKKYWIAHSENPKYEDFEIPISSIIALWRIKACITFGS